MGGICDRCSVDSVFVVIDVCCIVFKGSIFVEISDGVGFVYEVEGMVCFDLLLVVRESVFFFGVIVMMIVVVVINCVEVVVCCCSFGVIVISVEIGVNR